MSLESCHAADALGSLTRDWLPQLNLLQPLVNPVTGQGLRSKTDGLKKKEILCFFLDIKVHKDFTNEPFNQNGYKI